MLITEFLNQSMWKFCKKIARNWTASIRVPLLLICLRTFGMISISSSLKSQKAFTCLTYLNCILGMKKLLRNTLDYRMKVRGRNFKNTLTKKPSFWLIWSFLYSLTLSVKKEDNKVNFIFCQCGQVDGKHVSITDLWFFFCYKNWSKLVFSH